MLLVAGATPRDSHKTMTHRERTSCYLCGVALDDRNTTRDHVPPKGLFPRPFIDEPIIVPCCSSCNGGKSRDEEFFRLVSTLGIHATPETEALYEQRTLPGTIKRGRLKAEISAMMASMKHEWIEVNGVTVLAGIVPVPKKKLKKVAEQIARGLLAYFHPTLEVHTLDCKAFIPTQDKLLEVFSLIGEDLQELRLGGRVFHAYHGTLPDNPAVGLWLMTFHETIAAAVFHFDESLGEHEAEHGECGKASPATS